MRNVGSLIIGAVGVLLFFTAGAVSEYSSRWYANLRKPRWLTFERLIPFIWAFIYVATTTSAILTWRARRPREEKVGILSLLGINGLLNVLYTVVFTRRHDLVGAVVNAGAISATIAGVVARQWAVSPLAALLNVPYLLWASFATFLTWVVYRMNRGQQA